MATDFQHYSDTWHQDLPLVPSRSERNPDHALSGLFQTGRSLGSLSALTSEGLCSFEPGLPPGYNLQSLHLLNCGYRLVSADEEELLFLHVRPGLFLGTFPVSAVPELFSARQAVSEEGPRSVLSLGGLRIELTQEISGTRRLVRLEVRSETGTAAGEQDETQTDPKVGPHWEELWKQRMLWLTRMKAEERPVLFDLALEVTEACLNPSPDSDSGLWFRDPGLSAPGMPLRELSGLLPALTRMDPDAAAALLESLCRISPLPGGALPAFARLHPAESSENSPESPAWPVLALAVHSARQSEAPLPLPATLLSRLEQHLHAWVTLSDQGGPLPAWPDPETAFTPEIVDDDLELCDLAALLIAEIDAYRRLSGNMNAFDDVRSRWRAHLLEHHWSAARGVFLDRTRDGQLTKRMTLGGLLPLLWADLPEEQQRGLYRSLSQSRGLRSPQGLLQWEPRDDDPAPAPVRPLSQHLFLRHLLLEAPADIRSQMGLSWAKALDDHVTSGRGFPRDWDGNEAGWSPLTAGFCLRFAPLHAREDLELSHYPAWIRFLERQRDSIISTAATLAIVIPIAIGLFFALRPHYSTQQEQTVSGHGETMIALGRYAEAEEIFTDLLARTRKPAFHLTYYAQRGNVRARLHRYEAAKEDLRRAIDLDENLLLPSAHWNLAQVYWRLGDHASARNALEEFIEIFDEGYPVLGRNARNALALMDQGLNPFPSGAH